MRKLILAIFLLICSSCMAQDNQVNPESLDALKRSIENSKNNIQSWQDSFKKKQDSIYKSAISKAETTQENKKVLKTDPVDEKNKEKKMQHSYIRIGIGIIFFILLAIVLFRKRNKKPWL